MYDKPVFTCVQDTCVTNQCLHVGGHLYDKPVFTCGQDTYVTNQCLHVGRTLV